MPMPDFENDHRLDPRVARVLPLLSGADTPRLLSSRDDVLAQAQSPAAVARREMVAAATEHMDREEVASFAGTTAERMTFTSQPDGNTIHVHVTRPDGAANAPGIVYLHGGGMTQNSAFDGNYRAWYRLLAHEGAVVVSVDFRNAIVASSADEIAPYPGGLNDCVSGVRWVVDNADALGIDPARIVVAGESGGGNLALATGMRLARDGDVGLIKGLYAMCPYIAADRDAERYPSSAEFEGYFLRLENNSGPHAYGIDAYEAGDPLAWPSFATADDVVGLPPTVISVNECDPLRDEGIEFYRTLLAGGVDATCVTVMGTMHATEVIPNVAPDISRAAARAVVGFARD